MGYCTNYTLSIVENLSERSKRSLVKEISDEFGTVNFDGSTVGQAKWYDHEKDMIEISKENPHVLYMLGGIGEEHEHWQKYFSNGKMQVCKGEVVYQPFDPSKM